MISKWLWIYDTLAVEHHLFNCLSNKFRHTGSGNKSRASERQMNAILITPWSVEWFSLLSTFSYSTRFSFFPPSTGFECLEMQQPVQQFVFRGAMKLKPVAHSRFGSSNREEFLYFQKAFFMPETIKPAACLPKSDSVVGGEHSAHFETWSRRDCESHPKHIQAMSWKSN